MLEYLFDFMLPSNKSANTESIDGLFFFITFVGIIMLLGVCITIVYFAWRYSRKYNDTYIAPAMLHNHGVEFLWSVIPFVLIVIVFMWGFRGFLDSTTPPPGAYEIHVNGKKWNWTFSYPNGAIVNGELHIPVNQPIRLIMNSSDVIHSFFIPDFRIKKDVVPGRYSSLWFEAEKLGEHIVFCAEYCGTAHADMSAKIIVHPVEEFESWLEEASQPPSDLSPLERGALYVKNNACLTCHSLDGSQGIGPSFQNIFGQNRELESGETLIIDENYIRKSILEPQIQIVKGYAPLMPSYSGLLKDDQIQDIITYLKTIK